MWFHSVRDYVKSLSTPTEGQPAQRAAVRRRAATFRLQLEALEERCLLSSSPVLNVALGGDPPAAVASDSNVASITGSWTPAASMAEPRAFYSMTLLEDDRVLVAGGFVRTNGLGPPRGGH